MSFGPKYPTPRNPPNFLRKGDGTRKNRFLIEKNPNLEDIYREQQNVVDINPLHQIENENPITEKKPIIEKNPSLDDIYDEYNIENDENVNPYINLNINPLYKNKTIGGKKRKRRQTKHLKKRKTLKRRR
jgi:hypothetical protein